MFTPHQACVWMFGTDFSCFLPQVDYFLPHHALSCSCSNATQRTSSQRKPPEPLSECVDPLGCLHEVGFATFKLFYLTFYLNHSRDLGQQDWPKLIGWGRLLRRDCRWIVCAAGSRKSSRSFGEHSNSNGKIMSGILLAKEYCRSIYLFLS